MGTVGDPQAVSRGTWNKHQ